ncbi:hypothetical protein SD455_16775, partial [Nesterenkonia sp. K-15-9-6]
MDDTTGEEATAPLSITDPDDGEDPVFDPSVTLDPDTVAPGEDTTITGEGFVPDSTVTVEVT